MLSKEVLWCSVDNWHAMFKKVTFKSVILPIPNDVLEYLRSDGPLILPKECGEKDNGDSESDSGDENEADSKRVILRSLTVGVKQRIRSAIAARI